jgi:hypothetical protein
MVVLSVREYTNYDEFVHEGCVATHTEEAYSLAKVCDRGLMIGIGMDIHGERR